MPINNWVVYYGMIFGLASLCAIVFSTKPVVKIYDFVVEVPGKSFAGFGAHVNLLALVHTPVTAVKDWTLQTISGEDEKRNENEMEMGAKDKEVTSLENFLLERGCLRYRRNLRQRDVYVGRYIFAIVFDDGRGDQSGSRGRDLRGPVPLGGTLRSGGRLRIRPCGDTLRQTQTFLLRAAFPRQSLLRFLFTAIQASPGVKVV